MSKCPYCGSTAQAEILDTVYLENGWEVEVRRSYKCECGRFYTGTSYYNSQEKYELIEPSEEKYEPIEPPNNKKKLIIHETDCHGIGVCIYNGQIFHYSYDDIGDMKETILTLIKYGFINADNVLIIDGDAIYPMLEKLINNNEVTP